MVSQVSFHWNNSLSQSCRLTSNEMHAFVKPWLRMKGEIEIEDEIESNCEIKERLVVRDAHLHKRNFPQKFFLHSQKNSKLLHTFLKTEKQENCSTFLEKCQYIVPSGILYMITSLMFLEKQWYWRGREIFYTRVNSGIKWYFVDVCPYFVDIW